MKNYVCVWRQFNRFIVNLDIIPKNWEDRASLFIGYLIQVKQMQLSTIKSYLSAIKHILINDKYKWDDSQILLTALTHACKMKNARVTARLPISCGFMELILFELQRRFQDQPYLECLYKTLFAISYYGLMTVGEVTRSPHVLKAKDVHIARNKDKVLLVLHSSKTHSEKDRPQTIKITANQTEKSGRYTKRHFCPFNLMRSYLHIRGNYVHDTDPFFVFRDGGCVQPGQARKVLRKMISALGLNATLYDMHSFRIGHTSDLIKYNYSIDEVKLLGR